MVKIWQFTLFFLFCLVVALLLNLPIQQVLPHVKLPDTVRVAGIDGNLIQGSAQEIRVNDFPLRAIEYRFQPACLPLLKVCYEISYAKGDVGIAYDVLNGDTEVEQALIEYQVVELLPYLPNLLVKPAGQVELTVEKLSMLQGKVASVNGRLVWRNLGLDDDGIKVNIGDIQVDFSGDPAKYEFKLEDLDADLDVSGAGTVEASGNYQYGVKISSDSNIDPNIKSVLELVAAKTSYNHYRVDKKGRVPRQLLRQIFGQ